MGALLSYFLVSQAEAPGADDQDGRGQADERRQQKDHQEDQESGDVQNGLLTQLDGAVDDEGAHAGPHAGQGILDPGIFRKGPERRQEMTSTMRMGGNKTPRVAKTAPRKP